MDYQIENATPYEKMLCQQANEKQIPINGILELTPLCNMNCNMCYVRLSREEMEQQGRLRSVEEWLFIAEQMQKAGTLFVLFTGGEPLLYPRFRELYLGVRKLGMVITINTNGTLLDESWADFFAQYPPRRINITLYGASEQTYSTLCHYSGGFPKAIEAVRMLKERKVAVKVNGSLVPENREDGVEIIKIAQSMDAAVKVDTYMYPAERERNQPFAQQSRFTPEVAACERVRMLKASKSPEDFRNFAMSMLYTATHTPPAEEVPGKVGCRAGRSSFVINWQGEMRPCIMLTSPSVPVFETGFDVGWKTIVEKTERIMLSSKCSGCTLREVCNACAACAFLESGAFDAVPTYMCKYTIETLNSLAAEMNMLASEQEEQKNE